MDEQVERSLSRIFGDLERGHRIRKIGENAGLGFKTFVAGVMLGFGAGFGLSQYLDSNHQPTPQQPETSRRKSSEGLGQVKIQVPLNVREPPTNSVWEPDVRNKLSIIKYSDGEEIPPNYAKVPTSSGKSYLVPLQFNRIDSKTIPDQYTLLVREKTPVLADDRDVDAYRNMGYREMFKRFEPIEPPKQDRQTKNRLR